ncbi:hypothetical protein P7C73_g3196, partial [Tremellales sp. Uapishka_1]
MTNSPPNLVHIFTTSQTALPVRYPHPRKPQLLVPALIHRCLHSSLDQTPPSLSVNKGDQGGKVIVIPNELDIPKYDLLESDVELTVKLHLVTSPSLSIVKEALHFLSIYKGLDRIETLLIGFRGIDYKGKKTAASEMFGCGTEGLESGNGSEDVPEQLAQTVLRLWKEIHQDAEIKAKEINKMGTLYLPLGLLERLEEPRPTVNSLDTPDCHSLPKQYSAFAEENGIELWAGGGGEGSDPLPSSELHNLLQEFSPSSEWLNNVGELVPLRADGLKYERDSSSVTVRWVLGYTLVSKMRNVVKDKG